MYFDLTFPNIHRKYVNIFSN